MDSVHTEGILQILNPLTFLEHQLGSGGEGDGSFGIGRGLGA